MSQLKYCVNLCSHWIKEVQSKWTHLCPAHSSKVKGKNASTGKRAWCWFSFSSLGMSSEGCGFWLQNTGLVFSKCLCGNGVELLTDCTNGRASSPAVVSQNWIFSHRLAILVMINFKLLFASKPVSKKCHYLSCVWFGSINELKN